MKVYKLTVRELGSCYFDSWEAVCEDMQTLSQEGAIIRSIEEFEMTQEEFEAIPEFEGW